MTLVHFEVLKVDYFQQHVLMCLRLPDMSWFKWRVNIRGSLSVSNQFNPCFIWVCARADRLGNCICESETARCYFRVVLLCCWENLRRTPMFFWRWKHTNVSLSIVPLHLPEGLTQRTRTGPLHLRCFWMQQSFAGWIMSNSMQGQSGCFLCHWSGALNGWNMLKYGSVSKPCTPGEHQNSW